MKHVSLLIIFTLMSFVMGCQEKSSKKSSSSQNAYCMQYPYTAGCNYGTTVGGTTGGTCVPNSPQYWNTPSCPGFCQSYPAHASCTTGTTVGTTIGGITTGTTTGIITNPFPNYPGGFIIVDSTNWGVKYPGGVPVGSCPEAYAATGITYTPYETRKATMTIAGQTWYNPASADAPNYMNTSSLLRSVTGARQLFETDSVLKVRFKVKPQPKSSTSSPFCYGRQFGSMIPGYTKLAFNVTLVGKKANDDVVTEPLGTMPVTGVNSCTPTLDLSAYTATYPNGIYLRVTDVQGNQGTTTWDYSRLGFMDSTNMVNIRTSDCWVLDVEVAADGTKTFD